MIRPEKRVLLSDDPSDRVEDGPQMQFRLTYQGQLFTSQPGDKSKTNGDRKKEHKHYLRTKFHPQLKRLWEETPFLNTGKSSGPPLQGYAETEMPEIVDRDRLSKMHTHFGFSFIPLVTSELHLLCSLEFLILRPDPLDDITSGDIDNRAKTLIDALSIPDANQRYDLRQQEPEFTPFYCLLENDKLITRVSVETDRLLEKVDQRWDKSDARVMITVHLRPYELHFGNLGFGA
jgi:hypothetical protein